VAAVGGEESVRKTRKALPPVVAFGDACGRATFSDPGLATCSGPGLWPGRLRPPLSLPEPLVLHPLVAPGLAQGTGSFLIPRSYPLVAHTFPSQARFQFASGRLHEDCARQLLSEVPEAQGRPGCGILSRSRFRLKAPSPGRLSIARGRAWEQNCDVLKLGDGGGR
jgi:hypothetical protein